MLSIKIDEQVRTAEDVADLLEQIADMVRDGMTSGYYPHWSLDGTEEADEAVTPT